MVASSAYDNCSKETTPFAALPVFKDLKCEQCFINWDCGTTQEHFYDNALVWGLIKDETRGRVYTALFNPLLALDLMLILT